MDALHCDWRPYYYQIATKTPSGGRLSLRKMSMPHTTTRTPPLATSDQPIERSYLSDMQWWRWDIRPLVAPLSRLCRGPHETGPWGPTNLHASHRVRRRFSGLSSGARGDKTTTTTTTAISSNVHSLNAKWPCRSKQVHASLRCGIKATLNLTNV